MKEVKNNLPNSVLVNLYKESLVLGVAPANVDKKAQPSPAIEPETAPITVETEPIAPIKFLGEHQKKILVLVQDPNAVHLNERDFDLLTSVSTAVREMAEGELLQIEKARKLDITEDVYFDIIRKKTATLIAACCAVGVQSTDADEKYVDMAHQFGEKVGIAFQIKDDLFDYGDAEIGKPLGIDIKEKKMTLPLIYALQNTTRSLRKQMIKTIKNDSDNPVKVKEVIDFVKSTGGIAYATQRMQEFAQEAREILLQFPDSTYRTSLGNLLNYTIERNK